MHLLLSQDWECLDPDPVKATDTLSHNNEMRKLIEWINSTLQENVVS